MLLCHLSIILHHNSNYEHPPTSDETFHTLGSGVLEFYILPTNPHHQQQQNSAVTAGIERPSPEPADNGLAKIQDPNEPQKPMSAYNFLLHLYVENV
jgi:hypothetical protein